MVETEMACAAKMKWVRVRRIYVLENCFPKLSKWPAVWVAACWNTVDAWEWKSLIYERKKKPAANANEQCVRWLIINCRPEKIVSIWLCRISANGCGEWKRPYHVHTAQRTTICVVWPRAPTPMICSVRKNKFPIRLCLSSTNSIFH